MAGLAGPVILEFILTVTVNFKPEGLSLNLTDLLRSLRSQHEAVRASAAAYLGRVRVSASLDSADVTRAVTGLRTLGPMTRHRAPKRDRTLPRPQKRG
jgi:hypothetical protein